MSNEKPAHEIRMGAIKAAIWKNATESGPRYNVTFARLYREEDKWKSTNGFGRDDLLVVGKVADHAHSWICEQHQDEPEGRREKIIANSNA